jgi:3-phenylpropionate/cinnamic acid dioxygenase small subunit
LFDKIIATPEEWSWLRETDWYRPATAEKIRMKKAKYEEYARIVRLRGRSQASTSPRTREEHSQISEIRISPPARTGSLRIINPETLQPSSLITTEIVRSQFIPVKDVSTQFPGIDSPVEFIPRVIVAPKDPIIVTIDIKGVPPEYLEIAAIANFNDQQLGARIWYLNGRDDETIHIEARYCHGINPIELRKLAVSDIDVVRTNLKRWLLQLG